MMPQQLLLQLTPPPAPSLENFVAGRNGAALQALRAIAGGNGEERFVYLWGDAGSGRTHLLRALVSAAGVHGRLFAESLPDEAQEPGAVIAVDDVQHLSPGDQVRLFDLYNRVRAAGGALVASGDAAPAQLALRADLRSRLAWGLAFQLHPLSDAEKAEALCAQARARAIDLPVEAVAYLLQHTRRDMASLISILDALDRYSLQTKRPLNLALVREALRAIAEA